MNVYVHKHTEQTNKCIKTLWNCEGFEGQWRWICINTVLSEVPWYLSQYKGFATGWTTNLAGQWRNSLFATASRPALGPTQPHYPVGTGGK